MPCKTSSKTAASKPVGSIDAKIQNGAPGKLVVEADHLDDFRTLVADFVEQYQPASLHEYALVEDLAHHRWFLWCCQRSLYSIESEVYAAKPGQAKWSDAEFKRLALAARYRAQAERAFHRALKSVEGFIKDRIADYRWEASYDLAVRRLEFQKKKLELATGDDAVSGPNTQISSAKTAGS
jgi:hypothetical protein